MVTNENRRLSGFEKVGLFSALVLFSAFTLLKEGGNTATPVIPQVKKPLITISKIEERPPATATKQVPKVTVAKTGKTRKKPVPVEKTSIASPKQEAVHIVVSPKMSILKDTLPRKIQEDPVTASKPNREPLESEKVLAEIIRIKEEIGENKASIGRRKAQLEQQPEKEKEIMGRITEEREEIEKKRLKLDNLRVRLAKLRKQEEREQKRK